MTWPGAHTQQGPSGLQPEQPAFGGCWRHFHTIRMKNGGDEGAQDGMRGTMIHPSPLRPGCLGHPSPLALSQFLLPTSFGGCQSSLMRVENSVLFTSSAPYPLLLMIGSVRNKFPGTITATPSSQWRQLQSGGGHKEAGCQDLSLDGI